MQRPHTARAGHQGGTEIRIRALKYVNSLRKLVGGWDPQSCEMLCLDVSMSPSVGCREVAKNLQKCMAHRPSMLGVRGGMPCQILPD